MAFTQVVFVLLASQISGTSALSLQRKVSTHSNSSLLHAGGRPQISQTEVRPSAGKEADVIEFGLLAKNFYGTDLKRNTFKVDVVMSVQWKDRRVVHLVPAGHEEITMSLSQAADKIWMPSVVVTNRDIEMYEIISSAVTIYKSGEVLRVERALVRLCDMFKLTEYPFDTQELQVKLGSSKYMSDEVVLVPSSDKTIMGVDEKIWGGYSLLGYDHSVFEEIDGDLKKSRGAMDVRLKRKLGKYWQDHLVPTFILVVISWSVFYFPFVGPFITPRLVLSILALLTFTNLMIKSTNALPGAAPFNWNDLFNQQIQVLMFATIVINVTSEVIHHQLKIDTVSTRVNHEAKIVLPLLSASNIIIILSAAYFRWLSLPHATYFTQTMVAILLGGYVAWIVYITREEIRAREEAQGKEEAEKMGATEEGDADADADCGGDM